MKNNKYFFKDSNFGCTRISLRSIQRHLTKIGQVQYIRGYIDGKIKYNRVAIVGNKGRMILGGYCWGYSGEGPRGLKDTLTTLGVSEQTAKLVSHSIKTNQSVKGEEWRINFNHDNGTTFNLSIASR